MQLKRDCPKGRSLFFPGNLVIAMQGGQLLKPQPPPLSFSAGAAYSLQIDRLNRLGKRNVKTTALLFLTLYTYLSIVLFNKLLT